MTLRRIRVRSEGVVCLVAIAGLLAGCAGSGDTIPAPAGGSSGVGSGDTIPAPAGGSSGAGSGNTIPAPAGGSSGAGSQTTIQGVATPTAVSVVTAN